MNRGYWCKKLPSDGLRLDLAQLRFRKDKNIAFKEEYSVSYFHNEKEYTKNTVCTVLSIYLFIDSVSSPKTSMKNKKNN